MTKPPPTQKCRYASNTHGHKPGKCTNLATEPESLCKPCYDKTLEELRGNLGAQAGRMSDVRLGRRSSPLSLAVVGLDSGFSSAFLIAYSGSACPCLGL